MILRSKLSTWRGRCSMTWRQIWQLKAITLDHGGAPAVVLSVMTRDDVDFRRRQAITFIWFLGFFFDIMFAVIAVGMTAVLVHGVIEGWVRFVVTYDSIVLTACMMTVDVMAVSIDWKCSRESSRRPSHLSRTLPQLQPNQEIKGKDESHRKYKEDDGRDQEGIRYPSLEGTGCSQRHLRTRSVWDLMTWQLFVDRCVS